MGEPLKTTVGPCFMSHYLSMHHGCASAANMALGMQMTMRMHGMSPCWGQPSPTSRSSGPAY